MTSEFAFEGLKKQLNALNLKPLGLSRLLKLEESSMVLVDTDGNVHTPNEGQFDPPLENGRNYTVDGNKVEQINPSSQMAVMPVNPNPELAVVQGDQCDQTILTVIQDCRALSENTTMLYSGTLTVCLMQSLSVLASCGSDLSLVTQDTPQSSFEHLKNPNSFRASIYQLLTIISDAFRQANNSMSTIRAALSTMPDYFVDLIEHLGPKLTDEPIDGLINDILGDLKDSVDKCKEVSLEALKPINHVLEVVDELVHASSGTKNVNEKAKVELQKLIEQMEEAKLAKEEETRRLEQEQNEVKQRLDQAKNAYMNHLQKDVPPVQVITERWFWFFERTHTDDSARRSHLENTQSLENEYNRQSQQEQSLKQTMEQAHRELTDFMTKLKGMDTSSNDLASLIQVLQEGIALLSQIRCQWMMLAGFFDKVKLVIYEYLMKSVETFLNRAQRNAIKPMLREALKTVCLCIQICNVADIYTLVMDKHVLPELSNVGSDLALTEQEAKVED
uniref:Uncharacterized protein n=1 Tax=Acrobeloides nanus TaxID=290746 RepID=A0A914E830_9BILA